MVNTVVSNLKGELSHLRCIFYGFIPSLKRIIDEQIRKLERIVPLHSKKKEKKETKKEPENV